MRQAWVHLYVNIDDTWEAEDRDAAGNIHDESTKFPDMKALADYVHSKGLKIGIYSSPGPKTCALYLGQLSATRCRTQIPMRRGVSITSSTIMCSAARTIYKSNSGEDLQPLYQKMGEALQNTGSPDCL